MNPGTFEYKHQGQNFLLLPQKAIFWKEENCLIVSDLHIGKIGHFRKAGIAVPRHMDQEELSLLSDLINNYQPKEILFLGDLFHSEMNNDWNWFQMWRHLHPEISLTLVEGNHDIISPKIYEDLGIQLKKQEKRSEFLFVHEPFSEETLKTLNEYVICGHIHPGIALKGKGRQSLNLPCFYFGKQQAILPAFGKFTGKFCLRTDNSERIFAITGEKVIEI